MPMTFQTKIEAKQAIDANDVNVLGNSAAVLTLKSKNRTADQSYKTMGSILMSATGQARISFSERSKDSETGYAVTPTETYQLPAADDDLTSSVTYDIITSKTFNTITNTEIDELFTE